MEERWDLPSHVGYGVDQSPLGRQIVCCGPRNPWPELQVKTAWPPTSLDMTVTRKLGGNTSPTSPHSIPKCFIMNTFTPFIEFVAKQE